MNAARRVVLLECGMGVLWILLGLLYVGRSGIRDAWWVALVALVGTVGVVAADEHRLVAWDEWYRAAAAIVGVIASVIVVAAVAVLTDLVVLIVVGAALAGSGTGLVAYRLVFGVVRPLPDARLDDATDRSV